MQKILSILTVLTLLVSSNAFAADKIFNKNIEFWGVTNTGKLYLESKQGEKYLAEIKHCPINTVRETTESPALAVANMNNPRAWFETDHWFDDTGTPHRKFVIRDGLSTRIECITGPVAKI